jgi:hypothetical protein
MSMELWNKLLEHSEPDGHLLQFHDGDDPTLVDNVGCYLSEGLKSGEGLIVIARRQHIRAFADKLYELGSHPDTAIQTGQLLFLDVYETLAGFMRDGQPDWALFQSTVDTTVRRAKACSEVGRLRAYGEMVGALWEVGLLSAAIRLEHYWNELRNSTSFKLFCAYPIDVLSPGFRSAAVDALLCTHTHLLPGRTTGNLERALNCAMDDVLGSEVDGLRVRIKTNYRPSWAAMPQAEGTILWLRHNLPEQVDEIVARTREYYLAPTATAQA